MSFVLAHSAFAGRYPPEPHLISSRDEIFEGEAESAEFRDEWIAKHPFPGVLSTWQAKCDWLNALQKENWDEVQNMNFTNPPDAWKIASDILLEEAPDTIVVQLYARRDQLDRIQLPDQASKSRFAEGILEYGREDFLSKKGERTWEAYKEWLVENHSDDDDDKVLFGSVECYKGELLDDVCGFIRKLGLSMCADTVQELHSSFFACNNWGLMDKIGRNLYIPLAADKDEDKNDTVCFPLLLRINDVTPESMAEKEFLSRLEDITEETQKEGAGHPGKYYHLVKKKTAVPVVDSNGDERFPISPDNYHVLWFPCEYKQVMETIRCHFDWGKGESRDIQRRLQKGNTDTGNLKMEIFFTEFQALKAEQCWATTFARAFALTRIAAYDTHWMHDNEFPEEIGQMVTKLGDYWRNSLLKQNDETLGIGLGDLEKESESRKALICLLEMNGKQFKEASEYCKVKFTVVGRSRKKKASAQKRRKVASG